MNDSTLVATKPGATRGNSTRHTYWKRVAPSSVAASSSSRGTAATKPRSIQMANGRLNARLISTSGASWLSPNAGATWPADCTMKNSGMVSASTGTIWATSSITSSTVRPRKANRVSATADTNDSTIDPPTTSSATTALFRKYRPKFSTSSTRRNASSVGANVHGRGEADRISPSGFTADSTIQYSGTATRIAASTQTASEIRDLTAPTPPSAGPAGRAR